MLRINDSQKHRVLYTRGFYDAIVNFQCVPDLNYLFQCCEIAPIYRVSKKTDIFHIQINRITAACNLTEVAQISH